jgi:hypothetical protein
VRELKLPELKDLLPLPKTIAECEAALFKPHTKTFGDLRFELSCCLLSYMAWPKSPVERRECSASLSVFSKWFRPPYDRSDEVRVAFIAYQQTAKHLSKIQTRWRRAGGILQTVVDIDRESRSPLRGGASIAKAVDLLETSSETGVKSQLYAAWSEFKDVAHLIAASCHLTKPPQTDSLEVPLGAFARSVQRAPEAVLSMALAFQEFGLHYIPHGQGGPLLPSQTVWRVPSALRAAESCLPVRPLTEEQLSFLVNDRRSR